MKRETWKTFRDEGMLWWINRILHTVGWSIVVEVEQDTGEMVNVFPARTIWLGFDAETNEKRLQEFREGLAGSTPVDEHLVSPSFAEVTEWSVDGVVSGRACLQMSKDLYSFATLTVDGGLLVGPGGSSYSLSNGENIGRQRYPFVQMDDRTAQALRDARDRLLADIERDLS